MILIFFLNLLQTSVSDSDYDTRRYSVNLQTAFSTLTTINQVLTQVPENERRMSVSTLMDLQNQPCNQKSFYENLINGTFLNKRLHHPTFLLKPFYQSPEKRCFETIKIAQNLGNRRKLQHRHNLPQSVFTYIFLCAPWKKNMIISSLENSPSTELTFPRDADVTTFVFYILNSFFEVFDTIWYQLYTNSPPKRHFQVNQPCYVKLKDLARVSSIRYHNVTQQIDADDIGECNTLLWTSVTSNRSGVFHITFPGGTLQPFAPLNAKNDSFLLFITKCWSGQKIFCHPCPNVGGHVPPINSVPECTYQARKLLQNTLSKI